MDPVSYFKDFLVSRALAWGLERQRTCGQRRLPTSARGQECQAPSTPPLFGSRRKILHLRHQVSLEDDLLQLYSDSDEEEEEEEEYEEEEQEVEEERHRDHPCEAPELTPLPELEPLHHCPQLEALQEQLRLLEEEKEQLREEPPRWT